MNNNIQVLDCTLRDGAYIEDANFGKIAIKGIVNTLQDSGIEIIECGWLKNDMYEEGSTFYHRPSDFEKYLVKKNTNIIYAAMIDFDRYDLSYLPTYDGKSIDAIRVVFPYGKYKEGIEVGKCIKNKGYKVFFQAANTLAYSDDDLIELAEAMNEVDPMSVSIVDTFGAMYKDDLERIVKILDEKLDTNIKLGFHSHNNQQLSFALTIDFIEMFENSERKIIVDSSLCGMGRGAGNTTTELITSYLNRKRSCNYNLDSIMESIDTYMSYFLENYHWGYSTPYFIAGLYCCHVNNIAYLLKNHRTNAKDMRNIIESLTEEERKKYDYDLLENKYLENQNRIVDDRKTIELLQNELCEKNILLIAPGKTIIAEKEKIDKYILDNNPIVIGINSINDNYDYNYIFFINSIRYKYASEVYPEKLRETNKIILSNILTEESEKNKIINFSRVVKRGWEHFDNAVINCLRLLERLGINNVAIAGFDGFKTKYNESYADPSLPTLNPDNHWDELNIEIEDMYNDFKSTAKYCKNINFITTSIFNK